jgi:flagellar biosynthesis/type III secretory pathway protein FliH
MEAKYSMQHEEAEIAADINLNYERLQEARSDGSSDALQETFEQRMNNALDRYADLARFATQAVLLDGLSDGRA